MRIHVTCRQQWSNIEMAVQDCFHGRALNVARQTRSRRHGPRFSLKAWICMCLVEKGKRVSCVSWYALHSWDTHYCSTINCESMIAHAQCTLRPQHSGMHSHPLPRGRLLILVSFLKVHEGFCKPTFWQPAVFDSCQSVDAYEHVYECDRDFSVCSMNSRDIMQ